MVNEDKIREEVDVVFRFEKRVIRREITGSFN